MRRAAALVAAAAVLLSGCGVSMQAEPAPIPSGVLPAAEPLAPAVVAASPSATPTGSEPPAALPSETPAATIEPPDSVPGSGSLLLWFVAEGRLTPVESALPAGTGLEYVMQALVVGPTPLEAERGLRTIASDPPTGRPLAKVVGPLLPELSSSPALPLTVELSPDFPSLPPSEQLLLLGQVVLSLTGAGAPSVIFVDESGTPLAVPLPGGRLLDGPVRASDFALLVRRP